MTATTRTSFPSGRDRCAAWITYPDGTAPHPVVVLVHGFGATRQMRLEQYEQAFAGAGIAVLSFDFRTIGASGGLLDASRRAIEIQAPLLVCVSDHETLTDPRIAADIAERAPRGEMIRYPADHFEVYHPPLAERIIAAQVAFLTRHLDLGAVVDA